MYVFLLTYRGEEWLGPNGQRPQMTLNSLCKDNAFPIIKNDLSTRVASGRERDSYLHIQCAMGIRPLNLCSSWNNKTSIILAKPRFHLCDNGPMKPEVMDYRVCRTPPCESGHTHTHMDGFHKAAHICTAASLHSLAVYLTGNLFLACNGTFCQFPVPSKRKRPKPSMFSRGHCHIWKEVWSYSDDSASLSGAELLWWPIRLCLVESKLTRLGSPWTLKALH